MIRKLYVTSVAIDDEAMAGVCAAARAAGAGEIVHLPAPWLEARGVGGEGYHEIVEPDAPATPGLDELYARLNELKVQIEAKLAER